MKIIANKMVTKWAKRFLPFYLFTFLPLSAAAQYNESGISAGFFDSSEESTINFSNFHLPPLAVLFENAYGKTDMWGQNSSSYNLVLQQYQGSEQSYWNVGVNLAVPLEDILDLTAAVKRKRLEADRAMYAKDLAYENLKQEIATLFIKITNQLVTLKTAGEAAAAYQGAGALNLEDFHQGNMSIEDYAWTKMHELGNVQSYQNMQTRSKFEKKIELLTSRFAKQPLRKRNDMPKWKKPS